MTKTDNITAIEALRMLETVPNMPNVNTLARTTCIHQSDVIRDTIETTWDLYQHGLTDDETLAVIMVFRPEYYEVSSMWSLNIAETIKTTTKRLVQQACRTVLDKDRDKMLTELTASPIMAMVHVADEYDVLMHKAPSKSFGWSANYANMARSDYKKIRAGLNAAGEHKYDTALDYIWSRIENLYKEGRY